MLPIFLYFSSTMSLPKAFATPEDYFEACFDFFTKYKFILDGPNTDILINKTLNNIDIPDLQCLDVYDENFTLNGLKDIEYFKDFCTALERLSVLYGDVEERTNNIELEAPVGPKKKYEVITLAKEVEDICYIYGCDTVIDVGSGLVSCDDLFYFISPTIILPLASPARYLSQIFLRVSSSRQ